MIEADRRTGKQVLRLRRPQRTRPASLRMTDLRRYGEEQKFQQRTIFGLRMPVAALRTPTTNCDCSTRPNELAAREENGPESGSFTGIPAGPGLLFPPFSFLRETVY
ncbi:MAG: hypothetical protein P4L26_08720 [Terracidiphilus sp.]|nr:hypothetical protein [Terracidiphilus sp.]